MQPIEDELDLEFPSGSYEKYRKYFGKKVLCKVPVEWWSDLWHTGVRFLIYEGNVCSHHTGGVCLVQPPAEQGWQQQGDRCFVLTDEMELSLM